LILTGLKIKECVECGDIVISPFDDRQLNPNSYNVRLNDEMFMQPAHVVLDAKKAQELIPLPLVEGERCFILNPGRLYLGCTFESVGSAVYVPMLNGRSSLGRLGVQVHMTAGFGDLGFFGPWTLEFTTVNPIKLYPGMEIAQIAFFGAQGDTPFYRGKYAWSTGVVPSRLSEEFT
jgi:dCTP deaminase